MTYILTVCLMVGNNSSVNSSSLKFFLVNFNTVPILIFAPDFNLSNCVFVSLTLFY